MFGGKIVLQLLIVETDFKAVETFGIAMIVQDVLLLAALQYFGFLVVRLHGNTIVLVGCCFLLLDGNCWIVEAVQTA